MRDGGVGSCKITGMRTRSLVVVLVAVLLACATPSLAHVAVEPAIPTPLPETHALVAAAPAATGAATVLVAVGLVALAAACRRRALAVVCVALLTFIAFEAGLHSVHHLADHGDASCVIASASGHAGALLVERIAFDRPPDIAAPVAITAAVPLTARCSTPDLGRAPPTV
jgi:hypothetical protein